jgi:hypothetical protein
MGLDKTYIKYMCKFKKMALLLMIEPLDFANIRALVASDFAYAAIF